MRLVLRDLMAVVAERHGEALPANDPIAINVTVMQAVGQSLLDAHAATADEIRELLEDLRTEARRRPEPAVEERGQPTDAGQVTDRDYPGIPAGTSVALLAEEVVRYRTERNEARRKLATAQALLDAKAR